MNKRFRLKEVIEILNFLKLEEEAEKQYLLMDLGNPVEICVLFSILAEEKGMRLEKFFEEEKRMAERTMKMRNLGDNQ
ncbi:hypothetical protein [Tetragenococcus halophilus]|uniref:hypothetical protein n=1 Tax=Tetragenococcus halophilus TaxID=51669 RepID=UPI00209B07B6|nr:hypothetical protein [Tetragenococcus halophilus]MCO8294879.1 hypothetical protein [Tetragenococcus halophilus]